MSNQRADATTVVQLGAAESFIGVNYRSIGEELLILLTGAWTAQGH